MEEFAIINIMALLLTIMLDGASTLSVACIYGLNIFQIHVILTKKMPFYFNQFSNTLIFIMNAVF